MQLNLTVSDLQLTDEIGEEGSAYDFEHDEVIPGSPVRIVDLVVAQLVEKMIGKDAGEIRKRVLAQVDAAILEQVRPIVADSLTKPLQRTDPFGNPQGDPTTLAALVKESADGFLAMRVDSQGKPSRDTYDRTTMAQYLVKQQAQTLLTRQFQADLEAEAAKLRDSLRQAAADHLAKKLT